MSLLPLSVVNVAVNVLVEFDPVTFMSLSFAEVTSKLKGMATGGLYAAW